MSKKPYSEYTAREHATRGRDEALDEVRREIDVRRRLYDRWVAEGRLSHTDAHDRLSRMLSALKFLLSDDQASQLAQEEAVQSSGLDTDEPKF